MKNTPDANKIRQAKYQAKMSVTSRKMTVWVAHQDLERLALIAQKKGWINETGRGSGEPSMQQAIFEAIKAGIDKLEQD